MPSILERRKEGSDGSADPFEPSLWRIAIADDDPDILDLLRDALSTAEAEIIEATSGAELANLLARCRPLDLIITDVMMPWAGGLQILRSARAAELETPVLVVTGLPAQAVQAEVDGLGHARLLRKPFGIGELRSAIEALLGGRLVS
jgi:DNA-binding response OmpR family regulator